MSVSNNHNIKSPKATISTKFGHGDSNSKIFSGGALFGGVLGNSSGFNPTTLDTNAWMISPVCSRLRDHINMGANLGSGNILINSNNKPSDE